MSGFHRLFLDFGHRLRTIWRFAIFGFGFLFVQLVVGIGGLIVVVAWSARLEPANGLNAANLETFVEQWTLPLMVVTAVPSAVLTFVLAAVCRRYIDERPVASMGFVRPESRAGASVWGGLLAGVLPIGLVTGFLWALGGLQFAGFAATGMTWALMPTLVLMAFVEELVFRGYLLQNLVDIRRPVFGVLFTSIVFWIVHGLNPHAWESPLVAVNLFGAGVVLSLAYLQSGNIWFPTAMHFAWNAMQGPVLGLPVSGMDVPGVMNLEPTGRLPEWLTGGEFGLEASAAVAVAECLLVVLFWRGWRDARRAGEPLDVREFERPAELSEAAPLAHQSTNVDDSLDIDRGEDEDRPMRV